MKKFALALLGIVCLMATATRAQTLITLATGTDTVAVLKLIKEGANVNQIDEYGTTPLMNACRWGQLPMVKLLLANGAKVDEPKSPMGRTPLMVACAYYAGLDIISLLVDNGAKINAKATDGTTPLMLAAGNAKLNVVQYLLTKGATAKTKDSKGKTALDYAIKLDDETISFIKDAAKDCVIDKDAVVALLATK